MKTFKVIFEIDVNADNPVEAAESVQNMIQEQGLNWQWYVSDHIDKNVYSIDLDEDELDINLIPLDIIPKFFD